MISRNLSTVETCVGCRVFEAGMLCRLSATALSEFHAIQRSVSSLAGATIFRESEDAHGVLLICSGKVKLSFGSSGGKTLVLRIAKPGEVLGLAAVMTGGQHEVTAEALQTSLLSFIHKSDFLHFVAMHAEICGSLMVQLSKQYFGACEQLRTVGLSTSANEKLARLLLVWSLDGVETNEGTQIRVPWTHEQIAECVGSTRETISRTLGDFRLKNLISVKGATIMIPDLAALSLVGRC